MEVRHSRFQSILFFLMTFVFVLGGLTILSVLNAPKANSVRDVPRLHGRPKYNQNDLNLGSQALDTISTLPVKTEELVANLPLDISTLPTKFMPPRTWISSIDSVVKKPYFSANITRFPVIFDKTLSSPRAFMIDQSITLSTRVKGTSEMTKVFVHELSHIFDIYAFGEKNISTPFYAISWSEPTILKPSTSPYDFVSGYAATNQYEDFAESFTAYVFHSRSFLARAEHNEALMKKYTFFKETIFGNNFSDTHFEKNPLPEDLWDMTKVQIGKF